MIGKDFENRIGIKTPKGKTKMFSDIIDSAIFPGSQGGPLMHVIAGKAIAFGEAMSPKFDVYIDQVLKNAETLFQCFKNKGYKIVSNGTKNHLLLLDLRNKDMSGKEAEKALDLAGITVNKNMVPFDDKSPFLTSGIRIGTAAVTTRGLTESDMIRIADYIDVALSSKDSDARLKTIKNEIKDWISSYPLFKDID